MYVIHKAVQRMMENSMPYGTLFLGCDARSLVNVQVGFGPGLPKLSDSAAISAKFGMHAGNMQINI
jgi:hypothetical protein